MTDKGTENGEEEKRGSNDDGSGDDGGNGEEGKFKEVTSKWNGIDGDENANDESDETSAEFVNGAANPINEEEVDNKRSENRGGGKFGTS